jgi:hypothetical protein
MNCRILGSYSGGYKEFCLWVITPRSPLKFNRRLGEIYSLLLYVRRTNQARIHGESQWKEERTKHICEYIPDNRTGLVELVSDSLPNRCSNTKSVDCGPPQSRRIGVRYITEQMFQHEKRRLWSTTE